jgi:hypothetical protein
MTEKFAFETLTVKAGESLVLEDAAGLDIACRSGCVWITQLGDSRDIVLKPGQSVLLRLPTTTLMTADSDAELLLTRTRPAIASPRPWLHRLAGLFDPRWSRRAGAALDGRVRRHRALAG